MHPPTALLCSAVLLLVSTTHLAADPAPSPTGRPNILIILADDQGWGDLSISGNTNLQTPRIDSLGRDGAWFDRFFVCPVCSPTRAEFLTGRYHLRGGVRGVSTGEERLDPSERTIAQAFLEAGYATGAFGKWHNGLQHPYHPNARGFQEYYGFCSGHWGDYFSPPLDHNGETVQGHGFLTDDLTDHALQFMEQHRGGPFFCYVPFNTPHSPMQVPEEYWKRFADKELAMRHRDPEKEDVPKTRAALAMVENIDWNVGRLLDKLDTLDLADNTIVLYFSDNGPNSARWNDGMKGQKGSVDEGGVRSPLLIRWPGHIAPGTRLPQIAGAIDLLPTLTDLAGIPTGTTKPLDGRSLKPLLVGGTKAEWKDRSLITHWAKKFSLRTQQYRLDNTGALFDMVADPGQRNDIAPTHAALVHKLQAELDDFRKDMAPILAAGPRPFTVGYAPLTPLPARDGNPHGGIQRSANAPNCSFFTHWTGAADDRITWDVEAGKAGNYEAVLHYTCAPADVGSTIELASRAGRTEAKITEAHDPPLRGAENDRVPRKGESLVKEFKPISLGRLPLAAGRDTLTLRALTVPGKRVVDVRMLELRLVETGLTK